MKGIYLQEAKVEDIPKIIEIESKLVNLKTFSALVTEKEWKEEFNKSNAKIYLVTKDGVVVGDTSYEKKNDGLIYLSGLAIDPNFQKQGIGKEVMRLIMEELKNEKKVVLVVHPENSAAIKIYLSFGFVIKNWKDNYYGDGQPRIELVRELK
jgi:ribosomal protein S18 acetylase RimI-like enzyme